MQTTEHCPKTCHNFNQSEAKMGSYRKWLESNLPGEVVSMSRLDQLLQISGVLPLRITYRQLARTNNCIVRLREMIAKQATTIEELDDSPVLDVAVDALATMQGALRTQQDYRRRLLTKLSEFKPPYLRTKEEEVSILQFGSSAEVAALQSDKISSGAPSAV